jgi:hypothetical protein
VATRIRPIADASAGQASLIAVRAFNESEVLTALSDGSGDLLLIGWHTPPQDAAITRAADSLTQAGTAREVALTLMGRRAITAVRSGSDKLLLISWDVPPGLGSITRLEDSGTAAGDASQIAMTALSDTMLVTALRDGDGDLLLISWRLEPDGILSRLRDSGSDAGEASAVTIAALDESNVVTAVRNGRGNLQLIGWSVAPNGELRRWDGKGAEAGEVGDGGIAILPMAGGGSTTDVLTAVQDGSGNLLLIAWRASPASGTIDRLADSGSEARAASSLALTSTLTPAGTSIVLVSLRRGEGNLGVIAFELIADAAGAVIIRIGDYANQDETDVTGTALASLESGRILSASRINGSLALTTYSVSPRVTTLIRPIADGRAGGASHIAVQAFNENETLTALRNDSGNLELIAWHTAPNDFTITRGADSEAQAGTAQEVALSLMGRRAITAVRSGSGKLLLISWDVPPGLGSIDRLQDSGAAAGDASLIAMTAISDTMLVTAVRDGDGDLLLISWRLEPDGAFSRLHDSGSDAGTVSAVTIAALDEANVVTAVRDGSGNLLLIGWSVSPDGQLERWGDSGSQAREVSEIALLHLTGGSLTSDVVTAVQDGSGDLLLIAWRLAPTSGTIERLADSGSQAGSATSIALTSSVTPTGTSTVLASMRRGGGNVVFGQRNLAVIAFEVLTDGAGTPIITRTGSYSNEVNTVVTETALATLGPGRMLSACRMNDSLRLSTYTVTDAATIPAPATILELQFENPDLSITTDSEWASSDGRTYPIPVANEWVQVLAVSEEYDDATLVGGSGWVINPEYAGTDVPFDHPFGFDWEIQLALDDDEHRRLISPGNARQQEGESIQLAAALGLPVSRGLLGIEWDRGLLPQSFRALVNHGDRAAIVGRWILDTGHDDTGGDWRSEIHPPLLAAAASVHQDESGGDFTRVVFMSRPFLPGQTYTVDVDDAYHDAADDDGSFQVHMVNELVKVVTLRSRRLEAHPKVKSHPFRGSHQLHAIVRPPPGPDTSGSRLVVSFQFTVRTGCTVLLSATARGTVDVAITFSDAEFVPPRLPDRKEREYGIRELEKLASGGGIGLLAADALATAVAARIGGFIGLNRLVALILSRGIRTDEYDALPEINILDSARAVRNAPVDNIPAGAGVVVDNDQPYPIFGWLEARWVPIVIF